MENIIQNKKINKSLLTNKHYVVPQPKRQSLSKRTVSNTTLSGRCHHARLGQYAANLWKDKVMTDVLIVVQNQEFKAHKAVLACYSPYFSNVFVKPGFSDVHYVSTLPNSIHITLTP
uniref:BTB domain-containing protein n=2 Tax=Araneus ventricosus TaxID=182803 RepID=A0A4Y2E7T6_ARAVE|nr:hypothetical protein AVEN_259649-1 [Araneus ventricosus]